MVNIFLNGQWKGDSKFFQEVDKVDTLRLYNLHQTTSYWKNIAVCNPKCYSFIF